MALFYPTKLIIMTGLIDKFKDEIIFDKLEGIK